MDAYYKALHPFVRTALDETNQYVMDASRRRFYLWDLLTPSLKVKDESRRSLLTYFAQYCGLVMRQNLSNSVKRAGMTKFVYKEHTNQRHQVEDMIWSKIKGMEVDSVFIK